MDKNRCMVARKPTRASNFLCLEAPNSRVENLRILVVLQPTISAGKFFRISDVPINFLLLLLSEWMDNHAFIVGWGAGRALEMD